MRGRVGTVKGKAPVQACVHTFTHTHTFSMYRLFPYMASLAFSHTHCFVSVSLSFSTLLLQIITCLLSQCQSLGRQRDIGKIIIGKTCARLSHVPEQQEHDLFGSRQWGVRSGAWQAGFHYFVRSGYTVKMLIIVIINTQQLFPDKKHQEKEMFQCKGVTLWSG